MKTQISLDRDRTIALIDPRLFGGFVEHMGRCIYEGIYDPGSPLSDRRGFRQDVLAALQAMAPTILRYPGGNFLSGYHWLDGVGPRDLRPRRRELAWRSIETNAFGPNEFIEYCHDLSAAPMLGVNLGTGTIEEASAFVEYCNAPQGTHYSDLRARHGFQAPHAVKTWCLGNEMDGPWQIGHLEAPQYARKALEAAKLMKWQDPSIELVLCGSSNSEMPTYPEWDRQALEICWEQVDYLSVHYYANNNDGDTGSFLALARQFEDHIDTLAGLLRYVRARLHSQRQVYLSWDEWNIWYKNMHMDGAWSEAPHLIEEVYNLEDALVAAQWLSVFLRRSDVLKIACLAQMVNVIAPILTRKDGLLRQSIYYPFQLFRRYARGLSLDANCLSPSYETSRFGPVPLLDVSACHDPESGASAVFIVHRGEQAHLPVEIAWQGWRPEGQARLIQLSGDDPKAANSFDDPDRVAPRDLGSVQLQEGRLELALPPLSFSVLAWGKGRVD